MCHDATALTNPKVSLEILPLSAMDNVPALTTTVPAFPDPDVSLVISPPLPVITKSPALTVTVPASPLFGPEELELAKMPVLDCPGVPVIDSRPSTITTTLPPDPVENVLLAISPLLTIDKVPALTLTFPAFPVLPRLACEKMPVAPTWPCQVYVFGTRNGCMLGRDCRDI
jgi:hypothetical protein